MPKETTSEIKIAEIKAAKQRALAIYEALNIAVKHIRRNEITEADAVIDSVRIEANQLHLNLRYFSKG
jgi:predicted nucleic acid-binding protein